MTEADVEAAAGIYRANARDSIAPEDRAEQGFVQGRMSPEGLRNSARDGRALVAEIEGQVVGVTMMHPLERFDAGEDDPNPQSPPAWTVQVLREAGVECPILYGPSVVDANFRRRGVLTALINAVLEVAEASGYRNVAAFAEVENKASLSAHLRLGWQRIGGFTNNDRDYDVLIHPVERA